MPRLRPRVVLSAQDLPTKHVIVADDAGGVVQAPGAGGVDPGQSSALGRIVAYIPAEVIATYQAVLGLLSDDTSVSSSLNAAALGWTGMALLVATPIWIALSTKNSGETVAWHQVVISTFAFGIWLFGVGNPAVTGLTESIMAWSPKTGSVGLIVGAFLIALADQAAKALLRK